MLPADPLFERGTETQHPVLGMGRGRQTHQAVKRLECGKDL